MKQCFENVDPFDLYRKGDLVVSRTTADDSQFFGVVVGKCRTEYKIYVSWYGNIKQHDPDEIMMWPWADISNRIVERFEEAHKQTTEEQHGEIAAKELIKVARALIGKKHMVSFVVKGSKKVGRLLKEFDEQRVVDDEQDELMFWLEETYVHIKFKKMKLVRDKLEFHIEFDYVFDEEDYDEKIKPKDVQRGETMIVKEYFKKKFRADSLDVKARLR